MRLPALRFKDDDGKDFPEWKEKLVGEVFNDFKGTGLSKDKIGEVGKNKCILYGHLFTKYSEVITDIESRTDFIEGLASEAGDILMPSSTTTKGIDLAKASSLNQSGVLLGGDIIVLRLKEKGNSNFFAYFLTHAKSKDIAEITQGITIIHLYFSQLKNILLNYPCDKEQTKIANFLTAVDEKISHLTQKHDLLTQYKKGVMQQIFSQELRFKDDDGGGFPEWKETTLGDLCSITTGKLDANAMILNGEYRFYTCAKEYYRIDNYAFDTDALLVSGNGANVGYIHHYKGKFNAYQRTYVLDKFDENIIFIKYFLDTFLHIRIFKEAKEGNTPYIVMGTLTEMLIQLPALKEQTKIANFLTAIDDKIIATQSQLQAVKQYKQGLLQQMFV
jgi:type I restriction enzyme S subunit